MNKLVSFIFGFIFLIFGVTGAFAQATNFGLAPVGSTQNMSVSGSSGNITLNGSPGDTVLIQNTGANTAYIKCATAAATTDFPLQAGWGIALNCPPNNKLAAITATSTTTLTVSKGLGSFSMTGGGSGSTTGTTSVKSGSYVSAGAQQNALAIGTNTQLTVPSGSVCAEITVEGASIRRTSDTTSATTTNGTLIQSGAQWQDCGPLAAYKFTAVSGSPTLDVEYFK